MINRETALKILDYIDMIRHEESDKCMGGEEYECRVACADIAKLAGFKNRAEWTDLLMEDHNSMYYKTVQNESIAFKG